MKIQEIPSRTRDAMEIASLAITLVAKAGMYSTETVDLAVQYLREQAEQASDGDDGTAMFAIAREIERLAHLV